ncbi:hypothetical protein [Alcaligenes faecalis]|uniref:hypothetical protein n=1 Tax=Alcaligenes faecalis TaxID=511 RepID=UPI001C9B4EBD|nr:hypothetical protein [Alcaligenes faecalis]MBY6309942.1 hypothetical protein [Alcaligenes faecalis]MBY6315934.1 hypothetical protein [Alcaligenes faecalis]MBY6390859.1 hypothetical protein [Alcaligenes faecalis]
MHESIALIKRKTEELYDLIEKKFPDDTLLSQVSQRWYDPAIDGTDLAHEASQILLLLEKYEYDFNLEKLPVKNIVERLDHLKNSLVPNLTAEADRAVASYMTTMLTIRDWLRTTGIKPEAQELSSDLIRERTRIRALAARLNELEPKTSNLSEMVEKIIAAHQAADDLPTDLESLAESREKIRIHVNSVISDVGAIATHQEAAKKAKESLEEMSSSASTIIARCQSAYSAATSVGLAAAFHERAKHLQLIGGAWVCGLIASLIVGAKFGTAQLARTSDLLASGAASGSAVALSALLSLLSLGAPIWFAWISTRQVGQNFRLAEDYAFKASVSRAYEGYRSEAARIDADLEAKLLESALSRLDEQPLRLVEPSSPSSPLAEILQSEAVRAAIKVVPNFASEVKTLATRLLPSPSPTLAPKPKASEPTKVQADASDSS